MVVSALQLFKKPAFCMMIAVFFRPDRRRRKYRCLLLRGKVAHASDPDPFPPARITSSIFSSGKRGYEIDAGFFSPATMAAAEVFAVLLIHRDSCWEIIPLWLVRQATACSYG